MKKISQLKELYNNEMVFLTSSLGTVLVKFNVLNPFKGGNKISIDCWS
jgi:hypothetical protein